LKLDRLRWGDWIAAIAAVNLLLVTFRAWYKVSGGGAHVTAWDALAQGRYLLIATAIVGIFLFLVKATGESRQLSFQPGWITAGVGLACTVYIGYRAANPPSAALETDIGIYVGLISALGVTIGGLLSARESVAESVAGENPDDGLAAGPGAAAPAAAGLVPDTSMPWNPAAPAASTTGWSPVSPAVAAVPPATAVDATRPLRAGDHVVLTARGARHPAGTLAHVVEVFGGGALVEVTAADGVTDRFDVPEQAYERAPAGGATNAIEATGSSAAGESWSPAMPAATGDDRSFDEPQNGNGANGRHAAADEAATEKVPWWKREIGGGKKKKPNEAAELDAATNGASNEKSSIFKRLIGGRAKDEAETAAVEPEAPTAPAADTTPLTDVAGTVDAAQSAADVAEPAVESAVDEAPAESPIDPASAQSIGDEAPASSMDEPPAESTNDEAPAESTNDEAPAESTNDEAPVESTNDEAPVESTNDGAPALSMDEPPAESTNDEAPAESTVDEAPAESPIDPAPAQSVAEVQAATTPESRVEATQGGAATLSASNATAIAAPSAGEPEHARPDWSPVADGPATEAVEPAPADDVSDHAVHAHPRKRSSGSHKLPSELRAAIAQHAKPKLGDEVELKVGGGKYDAGTRGTVVDVFSAGVIVELTGDNGRTERLDVPFEAVGPADA
jgi:hypothetical protein